MNTPSTATREELYLLCVDSIAAYKEGDDAYVLATELKRLLEQQPAVTVSEGTLSNTPRTDELAARYRDDPKNWQINMLFLARQLEHELNTRIEQQAAESFKIVGFDPASPNGDRSAIVIQFPDGTVQTFLSATAPQSNTQQAVTVPKDVCSALASLFSKLDGEDKDTLNWLLDARRYALAYSPSASPGTNVWEGTGFNRRLGASGDD
jgi:hypothetical protein